MRKVRYHRNRGCKSRFQAGFSLIESLVTLLVMSILTVGTMYVSGKAAVSQKTMNANNIAIHRMRAITQAATSINCQSSTTASVSATSTINIVVPCSMASITYSAMTASVASGSPLIDSELWTGTVPSISSSSNDVDTTTLLGGSISLAPE
jgi:prepilin-type N-terminal cleavage/methylation domain-containing protein